MNSRHLTPQDIAEVVKRMHRADILNEFEHTRRYLENLLALKGHAEQAAAKAILDRSEAQGLTADEYFLALDESAYMHQQAFPKIFYYSILMHLCSVIEIKMIMLADKLHVSRKSSKSLADYLAENPSKDEMRDRISKYITEVTGINIKNTQKWATLNDVFQLRNIIAHAGGVLNSARASQKTIDNISRIVFQYEQHGNIEVKYGPYLSTGWIIIELSSEICQFFISEMKAYFEEAMDRLGAPFG